MSDTLVQDRFGMLEMGPAPKPQANTNVFGAEQNSIGAAFGRNNNPNAPTTALGHEATETHTHIAKAWQVNGCQPFGAFVAEVKEQAKHKRDQNVPECMVQLTDDLRLSDAKGFNVGGQSLTPFALNRLATAYAGFDSGFCSTFLDLGKKYPVANAQLAGWVNTALAERDREYRKTHHGSGQDFLLRFRKDQQGEEILRAPLSSRYGVIDNDMVLTMLLGAMKDFGNVDNVLISYHENDGDDMHGTALPSDNLHERQDSDYRVGIWFKNSEVGRERFEMGTYLYRAICENGCRWGLRHSTVNLGKKHLGNINLTELLQQVRLVVRTGLTEGRNLLTQMGYTRNIPVNVATMNKIIVNESNTHGLTHEQARSWREGWLNEVELETKQRTGVDMETAFGTVQGLTRAAQLYKGSQRENMETLAGTLTCPALTASEDKTVEYWLKRADAAKRVSDERVKQVLRLS